METECERYHVMLKGDVVAGTDVNEAKSTFAQQFQLSAETVDQLFDGNTRPIKKNLAWAQATQLKQRLQQIGVLAQIHVVMDAVSWAHAMVPTHTPLKTKPEPTAKPPEAPVHILAVGRIIPTLFSISGANQYTTDKGRYLGTLTSARIILSPLSGLLLAGAVGFSCQYLFVHVYESFFIDSSISVIGASLLFLLILFLHPLAMPCWRLSLTDRQQRPLFTLVERRTWHYLKREFDILNAQGELVAHCQRHRFHREVTCESAHGVLIYRAEEEVTIDDVAADMATALRERLVDFKLLDMIQSLFGKRKQQPSAVIRDAQGHITAQVSLHNPAYFRWHNPDIATQQPWLLLLAISVIGN